MIYSDITRFEVIWDNGRVLVVYSDMKVALSWQDDNKTLKVFLKNDNQPTDTKQPEPTE